MQSTNQRANCHQRAIAFCQQVSRALHTQCDGSKCPLHYLAYYNSILSCTWCHFVPPCFVRSQKSLTDKIFRDTTEKVKVIGCFTDILKRTMTVQDIVIPKKKWPLSQFSFGITTSLTILDLGQSRKVKDVVTCYSKREW